MCCLPNIRGSTSRRDASHEQSQPHGRFRGRENEPQPERDQGHEDKLAEEPDSRTNRSLNNVFNYVQVEGTAHVDVGQGDDDGNGVGEDLGLDGLLTDHGDGQLLLNKNLLKTKSKTYFSHAIMKKASSLK